ncbi:MAG: DUF2225 domain-containing protein [Oscillospiraceae bacterium]|nr:DUF2225 domain-containing protein [Oscillospiraceae bacterium]
MLYHLDEYLVQNASAVKKYAQGEVVARKGPDLYLLLSGRVGLYRVYPGPEESPAAVLEAGDFFGERALLLGQTPALTAAALTPAVLLAVGPEDIPALCRDAPEAVHALLQALCRRLASLDADGDGVSAPPPRPDAAEAAPPEAEPVITAAITASATASGIEADAAEAKPPAGGGTITPSRFWSVPSLFPDGHNMEAYRLPLTPVDKTYIYEKNIVCPVCAHTFKAYTVRLSRLISEGMDRDLRVRYRGVEPLYYDVVTCPKCWYSALVQAFKEVGARRRPAIDEIMLPYKAEMGLHFGLIQDTVTLFAGYYLALCCLPICFAGQPLLSGQLWLRLSRLYGDCADETMRRYAADRALTAYLEAYETSYIPAKQMQQLYYIIGELSAIKGNTSAARRYFFLAKTNKDGNQVIRRHAEDRLEELKDAESSPETTPV